MHPADIQARLKKRGLTQTGLAKEIGVSFATVHKVVQNQAVSDRVMRHIAARINMDPCKLFAWHYRKKEKRSQGIMIQDQCQH
jgi:lambda repressor-like predicted transcriptional regulator